MQLISDRTSGVIKEIFQRDKALIGMIHCPAFPGSPRYQGADMDDIIDACMRDAERLIEGGIHGLIVENHGDVPFSKPDDIGYETPACMAVVTDRIRKAFGVPLGISVLANAALPALATAVAGGAQFIRVNQWANAYVANEGFMEGRAAEAMRYRSLLRAERVRIFTDAHVKHGAHAITADRSIPELTRDLAFFDSDCIIATGQRTGNAATESEIREIKEATHLPLLVGSGVSEDNIVQILRLTDGVIVASSLKEGGVWWNPVDPERVRRFVDAAQEGLGD
ncbi:BtpA/SgcQ family protein [Paracoccus sp. Z330]|uniref:BtpA/SgcQ family protein n=1 Tax=Paracoccus onchidii TaxID=3017813 RepID=A0ABT4ZAC2_9RHOB|nr:BtpA/SgcQ family protein [Paracoccus onchidii]MDB6176305.1 BtpA/SgcQ family protein [Paracoccus onchidii]